VASQVEVHRALFKDVSNAWDRPIRFLWIDGDHTYRGAKTDFDGFFSHVAPGGIVALHDALNFFQGPSGFLSRICCAATGFGAAGFVHSIAWSQVRPQEHAVPPAAGSTERVAARLIPFVQDDQPLHGLKKSFASS